MERNIFCGKQNTLKHGHFGTIAAFWHCVPLTISYHLYLLCISINVSVTVWMSYFIKKKHTGGEGGDWGHGISK